MGTGNGWGGVNMCVAQSLKNMSCVSGFPVWQATSAGPDPTAAALATVLTGLQNSVYG